MIKKIAEEPIKEKLHFLDTPFLTREEVTKALDLAVSQTEANLRYLNGKFPFSAAGSDDRYAITENVEWTTGFWTGILWLMYEYTGSDTFKNAALEQVDSFMERVKQRIDLNHHDLGFLYTPSCVSCYKLTGSEKAKEAALMAADVLMERYRERDGFIQAWGEVGRREDYRLIIDCMMNIPLLYWASDMTGDPKYREAATRHFITSCNNVVRDDASAYHTFYFDSDTGKPLKGVTRQGYSDSSAWARGQAWGIYGIALNYRHTRRPEAFNLYRGMTNYFLNRLPADDVCYWDLIFSDGSGQSRDSSAAAIAVCGMEEMNHYLPETEENKAVYQHAMHRILRSLIQNYANPKAEGGEAFLLHGVYSWHSGKGVDRGNIWGDYYYVEALIRFLKNWNPYW